MTIKISRVNLDIILQHARECFPIEACGFLVGRRKGDEGVVEKVYKSKNILNSSFEYQIDPQTQLEIFEKAESMGLEVIGFYHSHPFWDPFWSNLDEERSKLWVGYSYLIVSLKTSRYRSYLRREEVAVEESVIII
ncbi:MAG: M67 family metallopeptidase [Candidatus Bathyarchaeia archaeon]